MNRVSETPIQQPRLTLGIPTCWANCYAEGALKNSFRCER